MNRKTGRIGLDTKNWRGPFRIRENLSQSGLIPYSSHNKEKEIPIGDFVFKNHDKT